MSPDTATFENAFWLTSAPVTIPSNLVLSELLIKPANEVVEELSVTELPVLEFTATVVVVLVPSLRLVPTLTWAPDSIPSSFDPSVSRFLPSIVPDNKTLPVMFSLPDESKLIVPVNVGLFTSSTKSTLFVCRPFFCYKFFICQGSIFPMVL